MKVFFTGSPRALKTLRPEHEAIFKAIEKNGGQNLSRLVIDADPEAFYEANHEAIIKHFKHTIAMVKKADIVVAEITTHSMSMGYIINKALELNKPTIALYLPSKTPFFFSGIENDKLIVSEYTTQTIDQVIANAFSFINKQSDIRFNFFLPRESMEFIDKQSKEKHLSRSAILRQIIAEKMQSNRNNN